MTNILFAVVLLVATIPALAQSYCQQALANANENERRAVGQTARDAAAFRAAAQNYRNFYSQNCTGSRGGYSGSAGARSANRADAVLGGIVGILGIMEENRQRNEAAAREAQLQVEFDMLQAEQERARRDAEAAQAVAAARAADDRQRLALVNPFGGGETPAASANPFAQANPPANANNPFGRL